MIHVKNVSKQFGYFFALKNISFNIKESTIFGVVGANGAGKSTLIKILAGLLKPSHGSVEIKGLNYRDNPNQIKKQLGIITDESFLFNDLTIFENLKYYENLHLNFNKKIVNEKIQRFIKLFNIDEWLSEPIRNLSHGMKQKVELIRAMIHHPAILLLDEPFRGLDYKATKILANLLVELKEKSSVSLVITTHNITILPKICNNLLVLKQGKVNKVFLEEDYNEIEIEKYF
ncbi:MAG: ABC transporter ATP-binding protein [Candidatus Lokiarchaeota archaeon]